jgi:hypothetical protein
MKSNFVRTLKSRRLLQAVNVASMGMIRNQFRSLVGKPLEKHPLGKNKNKVGG